MCGGVGIWRSAASACELSHSAIATASCRASLACYAAGPPLAPRAWRLGNVDQGHPCCSNSILRGSVLQSRKGPRPTRTRPLELEKLLTASSGLSRYRLPAGAHLRHTLVRPLQLGLERPVGQPDSQFTVAANWSSGGDFGVTSAAAS